MLDCSASGLKDARLKAGIDPQVLADRIGVNLRSYYRFENGTRRLYFDKACALADALGCSLDELRSAPEVAAETSVVVNSPDAPPGIADELRGWEL